MLEGVGVGSRGWAIATVSQFGVTSLLLLIGHVLVGGPVAALGSGQLRGIHAVFVRYRVWPAQRSTDSELGKIVGSCLRCGTGDTTYVAWSIVLAIV